MCKLVRNNILYRATKCPTKAEKIEYEKKELTFDLRGQNQTE